jgi:CheY-like chemotaxis protein
MVDMDDERIEALLAALQRDTQPPPGLPGQQQASGAAARRGRTPLKILVVDADPLVRLGIRYVLEDSALELHEAAPGREASQAILHRSYDLVIAGAAAPHSDIVARVKREKPLTQVLAIAGAARLRDSELHDQADRALRKPFTGAELRAVVHEMTGALKRAA